MATSGDAHQQLVWTVKEVDVKQGRVAYQVTTVTTVDGNQVTSDPEDAEWNGGGSPVMDPGTRIEGVTTRRETLEVPGAKVPCYVVHTNLGGAETEVWTAVKGDHEVFPGMVRTRTGEASYELTRVEGP
jgi:hypothetical protein